MPRLACWVLLLSHSLFWSLPSSAAEFFPRTFDDEIKESVRKYGQDYPDWLDWKAQLFQESRLDPSAVSPVGAAGICQVMPATWGDWVKRNGWVGANPHIAKFCIIGGQQFMADLRRFFKAAQFPDRQFLAQGGYNSGPGNIRKAQTLCGGAQDWATVIRCLPRITGKHARETITYVDRIAKWRAMMMAGK